MAFYPVSLNVTGRRCVVIGADGEANDKAGDLRECGADVHRVVDPATLRDADLASAFFVIVTPQDEALAARVRIETGFYCASSTSRATALSRCRRS